MNKRKALDTIPRGEVPMDTPRKHSCFPQWELGTGRILCRDCNTVMLIPAEEQRVIQAARMEAIFALTEESS